MQRMASAVHDAGARVPLRLRLDDVTRLDTEVRWLIAVCRELAAKLSLEVVPYHCSITGDALDRIDLDGAVEIAQHGYAHLPTYRDGIAIRGEFLDDPDGKVREQLQLGARLLTSRFGERFRGGYSAPYDIPPRGLAATWRAAGGRYLSWVWGEPDGRELPCVRIGLDPWDWKLGEPYSAERLVERVLLTIARDASIGLVLHPQCLEDDGHRQRTADVLRCLIGAGCVPTRIDPHAEPSSVPAADRQPP
jgi:hypothetical protein